MGKQQLIELETHGMYLSVPKGISMWPMIRNKRDIVEIHKLETPAKRYDLVMYVRGDIGVIHRVHHVREDKYVIVGDNCWRKEYIDRERVVGIATKFYRNGKWIDVTNRWYRIYVHLWTDLFFLRRPFLYLRYLEKRVLRRLRSRIKGNE
ncbi:MAG: S24/S26 family peptidase [Lachnospiraceae bacterium]|nr:S24/S26 family peptidase [Lachnospiraceae bacterium]